MRLKITGLKMYNLDQIKESMGRRNIVFMVREENRHGSNGIAYRAETKGMQVGYLPEADSVRNKWHGNKEENERLAKSIDYIRLKAPKRFGCLITDLNVENTSQPWIEVTVIPKGKG
jgi:hypothetical protein